MSTLERTLSLNLTFAPLVAIALTAAGCGGGPVPFLPKRATDAKLAELEEQKEAEQVAEETKKAAQQKISETEKQREELAKQRRKIQARMKRQELRIEAAGLVRAGEHQKAIDLIAGVFEENERAIEAEAREKAEKAAQEAAEAAAADGAAEAEVAAEAPSAPGASAPAASETASAEGSAPEEKKPAEEEVLPPPMTGAEKVSFLIIRASAEYGLESTEAAIATYEEALEIDSQSPVALQNLGNVLFGERRYAEAVDAWQRYFSTGVRDGRTLYLYGQALYEVGKNQADPGMIDAARIVMRSVLVERPADRTVKLWLASLEYETGRYEEAGRYYEALLAEEPLSHEYLDLLANCYIMTKSYDKAIDTLEVAARIGARDPARLRSLGDLYAYEGYPLKAATLYARAADDDPAAATAAERFATGMLFLEAEDYAEAERWLDAIEETDEKYYDAQARLAVVHRGQGNLDAAVEAFENMRSARPSSGSAHLAAAHIYYERGELEKAQRAYTSATQVEDTKADGLAGLAEVAYKRKDLAYAIDLYTQAAEAAPDEQRFRSSLQEIKAEKEYLDRLEKKYPTTAKAAD